MQHKIARILEAFEKDGEALVMELPMKDISVEKLRTLFDFDAEDLECIAIQRIEPRHVPQLEPLVDKPIDLDRYDWFYSVYSE